MGLRRGFGGRINIVILRTRIFSLFWRWLGLELDPPFTIWIWILGYNPGQDPDPKIFKTDILDMDLELRLYFILNPHVRFNKRIGKRWILRARLFCCAKFFSPDPSSNRKHWFCRALFFSVKSACTKWLKKKKNKGITRNTRNRPAFSFHFNGKNIWSRCRRAPLVLGFYLQRKEKAFANKINSNHFKYSKNTFFIIFTNEEDGILSYYQTSKIKIHKGCQMLPKQVINSKVKAEWQTIWRHL